MSSGFIAAVGVLVMLLGGALLATAGLLWHLGNESENWPTVHGTVLESRMEVEHDPDGLAYHVPIIRFRYVVDGEMTESTRIRLAGGGLPEGEAEELVAKYPVGAMVTVFVPPGNPKGGVLEPGVPGNTWLPVVAGVAFLAFGVGLVIAAFRF